VPDNFQRASHVEDHAPTTAPKNFRLKLEGKLAGLWVGELQQCWQTAASTTHGRSTVVDLRDVDFVEPRRPVSVGGDCTGKAFAWWRLRRSFSPDSGNLGPAALWYG